MSRILRGSELKPGMVIKLEDGMSKRKRRFLLVDRAEGDAADRDHFYMKGFQPFLCIELDVDNRSIVAKGFNRNLEFEVICEGR